MMSGRLKAQARTAPFVMFNVAALLGVYVLVVQPILFTLNEQVTRLNERAEELERYRAFGEQEKQVRVLHSRMNEMSSATMFLSGAGDGATAALVQERLKEIGVGAGLQIRSLASLDPYSENGVRYLGALMDVSGPIASIYNTLKEVENSVAPILFVKVMTIRAPAATDTMEQEPILNAQFEIYGATGYVNATQ